jgi:large subunit ribosomal protein L18
VIDDAHGTTVVSASSADAALRSPAGAGGNVAAAKLVGKAIAERALAKGIEAVVFDRGGYLYHGRVKALADAARENGLRF